MQRILKFGIGPRLFVATLLCLGVLGGTTILTVRWSLLPGQSAPFSAVETGGHGLVGALQAAYKGHRSWGFLPSDAHDRRRWIRALWIQTLNGHNGKSVETIGTYGDRVGLVDTGGHLLSGVSPGPVLRAFGSIDTRSTPLMVDGRRVGYLVVAGADNVEDTLAVAFLLQQGGRIAAIAAAGVLLALALAVLLAGHFRRPIATLVRGARMLEDGRYDTRMDDSRSDELGALAGTFNHLAARLETSEMARRQWVADTSHELRTPLAVLRAQIESLQDGIRSPTPKNLELMLIHVESLTRRVDDLYLLAQSDMAELHYDAQPVALWPVIEAVADSFRDRAETAGLEITRDAAPPRSTVICDTERMRQVLVNLIENAVRYTDAGGSIHLGGANEGGSLIVTIEDSAPGVPEASLDRLGERWFRTDQARAGGNGGVGLGLALVRRIVEAHAGRITFAASDLGGLQVRIELPLVPE